MTPETFKTYAENKPELVFVPKKHSPVNHREKFVARITELAMAIDDMKVNIQESNKNGYQARHLENRLRDLIEAKELNEQLLEYMK